MKNYKVGDKIEFILHDNELLTGTILRIDGLFKSKIKVKEVDHYFKRKILTIHKSDIVKVIKEIEVIED